MKSKSYAEITLKSGAQITFPCVSISYERGPLQNSLTWKLPDGAVRRPVRIDLDEIAAVIFVDGSQ